MGTFKIKADNVTLKEVLNGFWGNYWTRDGIGTPATDQNCIDRANAVGGSVNTSIGYPGSATLRFSGQFYLDGDTEPTYINDLPPGFSVTGARVIWGLTTWPFLGNELFLEFGAVGERSESIVTVDSYGTYEHPLDVNGDQPSALHLFTDGFGFKVVSAVGGIQFSLYSVEVQGEYDIVDPEYWQQNPVTGEISHGPLNPELELIDPPIYTNPATGEFLVFPPEIPPLPWIAWIPLEPISFIGIPLITPTTIVPILLPLPYPVIFNPIPIPEPVIFTPLLPFVPDEDDDPGDTLVPSNPVQTDNGYTINVGGSAIMVFIENPSGIYTLINGQTHDTLYDRTGLTSLDVKIPNPFVETGFMGQ